MLESESLCLNRMTSYSQAKISKGITLWPLIAATYFMVSGGPYGLEDVVRGAGYGGAILLLLVTPLIWSLPTALMVGELSSAIPAEGGYYIWVRRAAGPFWGFQEAWLSLAASVFDMAIYPTLFVAYLSRLFPGSDVGWHAIAIGTVVIALCVVWNLAGGKAVGDSSLVMLFIMLGPFVVLTAVALLHSKTGLGTPIPPAESSGFVAGLMVCMWNYMGFDNASNVGGEVENPQRVYPLAMILSIILIAVGYIIPIAAMSRTGIASQAWTTGAWASIGGQVVGRWLEIAIIVGGMIAALATFNSLLMSYSRLPMAMAEDGLLPPIFALKTKSTRAPWVAIISCAILWGACLGLGFERLVTLDIVLWGASMVLEFVALVVLRIREPQLRRPFRVPGGVLVCALLGVAPTALIVMAGLYSRGETIARVNALWFSLLVVIAGVAVYGLCSWNRVRLRSPAA
jgi:amino acid transporter